MKKLFDTIFFPISAFQKSFHYYLQVCMVFFSNWFVVHKDNIDYAFFVGGLGLTLFKLNYSLIYHYNPPFYYNISILISFWLIQFKFPFIIKRIREYYVETLKVILGRNFWAFDLEIFPYNYLNRLHDINKYKLKDCSPFNKFMQFFFFKSIQLELFKQAYSKIFFWIHMVLIVNLIFNSSFLVLNVISLIFLICRFNLLLSDWTLDNFYVGINELDNPEEYSYILPTKENGIIISLWATRTFQVYTSLEKDMKYFQIKKLTKIIHIHY